MFKNSYTGSAISGGLGLSLLSGLVTLAIPKNKIMTILQNSMSKLNPNSSLYHLFSSRFNKIKNMSEFGARLYISKDTALLGLITGASAGVVTKYTTGKNIGDVNIKRF